MTNVSPLTDQSFSFFPKNHILGVNIYDTRSSFWKFCIIANRTDTFRFEHVIYKFLNFNFNNIDMGNNTVQCLAEGSLEIFL